jgi:SAM-dependent methyltransferase
VLRGRRERRQSGLDVSTEPIADFFDREACCRSKSRARRSRASRAVLQALEATGVGGRTVLELGCGLGGLCFDVLDRGAARATGIDLSPRSIDFARERARSEGVQHRTTFLAGDAAAMNLEPHDVVVLDKVFCCYPDGTALLGSSIAVSGSVYAYSVPESRGWRGLLSRIGIAVENGWRALRRDPFRAYVHDVGQLRRLAERSGFRRTLERRTGIWLIEVLTRSTG